MKKYRKKPVVIEAVKLGIENYPEISLWINDDLPPEAQSRVMTNSLGLEIRTLEGYMQAAWGDYVIKGIKGEFYPCKPEIFNDTYDEA